MICNKNSCCGCGLCFVQCPVKAIQMRPDEEGFLYPEISDDICIRCGICENVCPILNTKFTESIAENEKAYAGFCTQKNHILKSSSGGAAYAIAYKMIKQGGIVFGVRYTENFHGARFTLVDSIENLGLLAESKYVETSRQELFEQLKIQLGLGKKVLVIGLPCDIAAVKILAPDNPQLYTCKLICRSNTSNSVLNDFLKKCEKESGSAVKHLSLRYKIEGMPQLPTRVRIDYENGDCYIDNFTKTDFGIAFQILARPSCLQCRFKAIPALADLTLGDFQGINKDAEYYNIDGVSLIIQHTEKGLELLQGLDDFYLKEVPYGAVTKYNWMIHSAIPESPFRKEFSANYIQFGLEKTCMLLRKNQNTMLDQIANHFITTQEKAAVWGIGDTTENLYDRLKMDRWNITGVYDSSALKVGRQFKKWTIKDIKQIVLDENMIDSLVVMIPSEKEEKLDLFIKELGWEKAILHIGKYKFYKG